MGVFSSHSREPHRPILRKCSRVRLPNSFFHCLAESTQVKVPPGQQAAELILT